MSTNTVQPTVVKRGSSPLVLIIVGGLILAVFVASSLLQIQTTEAYILGGSTVSLSNANWQLFLQLPAFVSGQLSGPLAEAVAVGWGMEIITLIVSVAYEVTAHAVGASSDKLRRWYGTGAVILMALNGFTDYNYGTLSSGWLGQLLFAGVTSFIVVFGLVAGIACVERAFVEFRR